MKRVIVTIGMGAAMALFQAGSFAAVDAQWAQAEAKEHGCLNCHAIDTKKVGPSFKEVSARFKGKTPADLAASVKGKPVHQSALKKTSEKDLGLMTEWILSL